jgi:g-D-glutamyl-meso-diaminopimelate peptidase
MLQQPYSYDVMRRQMDILQQKYPTLQLEVIGHSVQGREIIAVKLGQGKREVHYNAAIHANEWITAALLMKFSMACATAFMEDSNPYMRTLLAQTSLWVVPMLNPDGVELVLNGLSTEHSAASQLLQWNNNSDDFSRWKANIRGVDLNDQFPANWDVERVRRATMQPGPMNYSGEAPLTEPEAIAIASFTLRHSFDLAISLHTQGEEIYWNYRDHEPAEAAVLSEKLAQASGYRAVKLSDSDAGYKDWFIQQFRKPGFTVEAGLGMNPLPLTQFDAMYDKVSRILLLGLEKF